MAFALRKMFSISYFSKSGDRANDQVSKDPTPQRRRNTVHSSDEPSANIDFPPIEPDSTSLNSTTGLKLPESIKTFTAKKGSLSDTDLLAINNEAPSKNRRLHNKNLKLDIKKASQSMSDCLSRSDTYYVENTPKHILLDCRSADLFSEKLKKLNFNCSFEYDDDSDTSENNIDIESLSECSVSDLSGTDDDKSEIKMCRKVELQEENQVIPSVTPESFGDVELDKNEEERMSLLLNYQMKFEKMECVLKKLLAEFQFHIEVSKIFNSRSTVTALPGIDVSHIPKILGHVTYMDNVNRDSPTESWNIIMEKEDANTKLKMCKQLLSLRNSIDQFVGNYLQTKEKQAVRMKRYEKRGITFDLHKGKRTHKSGKLSDKKRIKHFDFPDLRDAFLNLFQTEADDDTVLNENSDKEQGCSCQCHNPSQTDSGLTSKTDNLSNQSITSSIGNFSLDSTTLSAYSESLDQVISYNSFQDTSLLNSLLQKPAIERVTFYVQVHSIQLKCESMECCESKNAITFYCPACDITESDENGLLIHILSQQHCEKIHFLYKTAYIKKCMSSGKEIQPSTILNPMTMYRDDNKIVCFGDAMYACSLCFENLIVGESILMMHCNDADHVERREKLDELLD